MMPLLLQRGSQLEAQSNNCQRASVGQIVTRNGFSKLVARFWFINPNYP
jgi:hypothetical protein